MTKSEEKDYIVTNRARGKMLDHAAAEIYVRDFPVIVSDEPPSRGGKNRGATPLEHILVALCA